MYRPLGTCIDCFQSLPFRSGGRLIAFSSSFFRLDHIVYKEKSWKSFFFWSFQNYVCSCWSGSISFTVVSPFLSGRELSGCCDVNPLVDIKAKKRNSSSYSSFLIHDESLAFEKSTYFSLLFFFGMSPLLFTFFALLAHIKLASTDSGSSCLDHRSASHRIAHSPETLNYIEPKERDGGSKCIQERLVELAEVICE